MQFHKIVLVLCFLIPLGISAQEKDITGLWKGTLFNDTTQKYYKYEIGISKEKGKYTGFSHTWFLVGDTQYFGVKKVSVKLAPDGKILIEDNGLIAHNYPIPPNKGVRQLNVLTLNAADSIMTLAGPFATNRTKDFHSLTGSVSLQRKNDFWQSSLVPHLQELGRDEELSFVKEEKQALAKTDAAEREWQLAQKNIAVKKEREQTEKQKQEKAIAKLEAERKVQAEQALAKLETAKDAEIKKAAAEKEKTTKALTRQEQGREAAVEKELARQTSIKEKEEREATLEKEKQEKVLAKQGKAKKEVPEAITKPVLVVNTSTEPAADVASRKTIVQQTVIFSSDSLQLSLYDNGEIDGDTVSVLMNGQLILPKQGLGIKAIKHTIYIPHNVDRVEMVMYAETLGSIPPNTGLLVIKDGKDLYEIRFSGDLQKNASIVFNRKKE